MDVQAYQTAYDWMRGAIDMTWVFWDVAGTVILMRFILKFLYWSKRKTRNESFDGLADDMSDAYNVDVMGRVDRYRSTIRRKWGK